MNVTISTLILHNINSRSPFLHYNNHVVKTNFNLYHSSFLFFKSSFLSSNQNYQIRIKNSIFSHFLDSSIDLSCYNISYINHVYDNRTFYENDIDFLILEKVIIRNSYSQRGGCFRTSHSNLNISNCIFHENSAEIGGAFYALECFYLNLTKSLFIKNQAKYDGALMIDFLREQNSTNIVSCNVSSNAAKKWTGGIRIDRAGGNLTNSLFSHNSAEVSAGFFDYAWMPMHRDINYCFFLNNTANGRGGAYTCFHLMQSVSFLNCLFINNSCNLAFNSISVQAFRNMVNVNACYFNGESDKEIGVLFGNNDIHVINSVFSVGEQQKKSVENFIRLQYQTPILPEGYHTDF